MISPLRSECGQCYVKVDRKFDFSRSNGLLNESYEFGLLGRVKDPSWRKRIICQTSLDETVFPKGSLLSVGTSGDT